jgi:hypothetical protein
MEQEQTIKRDKLFNRIFYIVFFLLIIGSVAFTFYRIYIKLDYQILAETSCVPNAESTDACFVRESEVATTTPDGVEATTTETSYYRLVSKMAAHISACEKTGEKLGCSEELTCLDNEKNCSYEYCTDKNVPDGESCYTNEATTTDATR